MLLQASFQSSLGLIFILATVPIPLPALQLSWPLGLGELKHVSETYGDEAPESLSPEKKVPNQLPIKIRKMSGDEGEMFWPDYWSFDGFDRDTSDVELDQKDTEPQVPDRLTIREEQSSDWSNASIPSPLQAPFALHAAPNFHPEPFVRRFFKSPRDIGLLDKRAFSCPGDTTACTSINRPNSCCPNGSTCESITDTGQGDVGCCGEGQSCGGNVANCPSGDMSCPDSAGGGCCVSGYTCASIVCVVSSTAITTVQPVVTASPPSSTPKAASSTTKAPLPTVPAPLPSLSTSNTNVATSVSTFTAVTSVIATATATSSRISSPSSSSSTTTPKPTSSSSASAVLPVRPTSSAIPTITTTAPPTTITASTCPTGFYQCSAYDHAGCCRVGRDCGLTSCPAASSTLALNSNGVTVNVIPSGTGDAALGASGCAVGWFSCAAGQGGGCCPSGYACGTSCTATGVVVQGGQTGTATVAKNNDAKRLGAESRWMMIMLMLIGGPSLTALIQIVLV